MLNVVPTLAERTHMTHAHKLTYMHIYIFIHASTHFRYDYVSLIYVCLFFFPVHVDAVCNSRHFNRPTRTEFQAYAKEALRSAKQRHRMATQVQRNKEQHVRTVRDYWKDNENEERHDVESNMDSHDEDD